MGVRPTAWACLLLAVHQGLSEEVLMDGHSFKPPEEVFMNERSFKIPIRITNPSKQAKINRFFLYVSENGGQDWQVWSYAQPDQKYFLFTAKHDGKYLFIVGEEDQQHRTIPSDPIRVRPNQCVVVDTVKPRVQVLAERLPNGQVQAHWTITEEYQDPYSLRLGYQTAKMKPDQWTPLPIDPQSGQNEQRFDPGSTGEVHVRVWIKDHAGNLGEDKVVVPAAASAVAGDGAGGTTYGAIPTVREQTNPPTQLTSRQTPHLPGDAPPPSQPKWEGDAPRPLSPSPDLTSSSPTAPAPVAASSPGSAPPAGFAPETARGALPPVKIISKREVKLEFEVAKFGPSGLGGADVYVTVNEGATWERWPAELPVTLPTVPEAHSSTVRGSVAVTLPREGIVYGLIVAIKSKAGLARPAPKPGEPPQVRIEVDATAPKAELFGPLPDQNQRNALILSWSAVDRNLPNNSITLAWAERKDGQWNTIGDQLPNNGQHLWRLPEQIPSRVYLKLLVRDTAGNVAVAQTDKPVLIDLSVPETNIIGVAPNSR